MQRVRVSSEQSAVQKLGESQLTLSPKFRLGLSRSAWPDPSSDLQLAMEGQALIPGLPDDVALNCLLRLPVEAHEWCRAVCKRWHLLLSSKERFFSRRKELGFHEPWLFVYAFCKCTEKARWQVFDPTHSTWHSIPCMPCKKKVSPRRGFKCVSVPDQGTLFVCGGIMASDVDCPLDLVVRYEVHKNRWTVMSQMATARSLFASGVIDGMVYVAGGNSNSNSNSAEVLDPVKGNWRPIARMGADMASYDSAVLDGKLLATEGWLWPFFVSPRGQVYDPRADAWENMPVGLREGWTGSSVVVYGHLFVVSEHERMKLKVYDKDSDSWDKVQGPPLPEQICKPFSVNSCDSRIYVVGRSLHLAVGFISRTNHQSTAIHKSWRFSVRWNVVHAPDSSSDFTPSTSQVLYA